MAATQTIDVPHLGGIKAGYAIAGTGQIDPAKPTCVLINAMCMTVALYRDQFDDERLAAAVNLLAIEPLGHGATSCPSEHFTYWDTAIMALQVLDKLGVEKAYALGTSQGGWMVTRMALLAPERIQGLLVLGTSMDYESSYSRSKGCWDPATMLSPFLEKWSSPIADFVVDDVWCGMVGSVGFGDHGTPEKAAFWTKTLQEVYRGDEGRKKAKMALLNLLSRDGLLLRLKDIKCPVHWLQGTKDIPYGTTVPAEHIKLFTSAPKAELTFIPDGGHYLNATNPVEVADALINMITAGK
ncbi:lpha beta [Diaporthe amygdali]|uniref:lpha beta n=1 Tax=Phomopsis amygdali TaxID=1214568 RepID=UPI0022FE6CB9|nr:lpha beta [Diaporthe amygdali]KAJ0123515.1 lpha beta [Diaporthe amygdali]